jgi:hypothetical protein
MHIKLERISKGMAILLLAALIGSPSLWASAAGGPATGETNTADSANTSSAGTTSAAAATPANAPSPELASELEQLRTTVEAEAKKFEQDSEELANERASLKAALDQISALEAKLGIAPPAAAIGPALAAANAPAASGVAPFGAQTQTTQPINVVGIENPLSIKIGGAEFTPGGFIDLTGIFRSTNVGTGNLGTSFPTLPFRNTLPQGQLSEFRFTGQGSRISLKVDANPSKTTAITGYFEGDFNGYEPPNSDISTQGSSFRIRLAWAQIRHDKWELLAGQSWTLLTPIRVGLSPDPGNIFTGLRLDTNYLAGLVFDRQPGLRFTYHLTDAWQFAVAAENPECFVPSSVVFPTDGATNFFSTQCDNGSSSTSAARAATNTSSPELHPDIIAKTALDWHVGDGKLFHIDAGGVARSFKDYSNLIKPAGTNTITGGGGQFDLNFEVLKGFHLIANSFYGDGVGRYIGGLGPDIVVRPNGTLSAVHAGSGVAGFEWQATPNFLVDSYYSGAYFWRNFDVTTKALGTPCGPGGTDFCTGFGFVGSANTNNKSYQEATVGFIPTIWSSPNYGKLQVITQFSYAVRAPWYVPVGSPKNAHAFISYVNLRYIIP